ncbi:MAG: NAD(P)/FAD-dependent oxidoreductase, partial [Pedobacter sp.]
MKLIHKALLTPHKFYKAVNILKNIRVTGYDGRTITTNSELSIESATVIWTAGVMGEHPKGLPPLAIDGRSHRIRTNEFNQVVGLPNVFAIGDVAQMEGREYPQGHPQMAQPAIQMGNHLAENLQRLLAGTQMRPFEYT